MATFNTKSTDVHRNSEAASLAGLGLFAFDGAMSGYNKSPDYGGPEPSRRSIVIGLLAVAVVCVVLVIGLSW